MRKALLVCSVPAAMALLLLVSTAKAGGPVEVTAGAKGFVGGNLFTTPSDTPPGWDAYGFSGNAGGMGWGAGIYGEARFVKFLGLELGVGYDSSTLLRNVTLNSVLKIQEKVVTSSMRIPVLVKGIVPVPFGRISVFLGPEFVRPTSADASNELKEGEQYLSANDAALIKNGIKADTKSSTLLTMGLGVTLELPAKLELPIELRASKNMSQGDAWADRVDMPSWQPPGQPLVSPPYTVTGQNSWDFRLGIGLGYRF